MPASLGIGGKEKRNMFSPLNLLVLILLVFILASILILFKNSTENKTGQFLRIAYSVATDAKTIHRESSDYAIFV